MNGWRQIGTSLYKNVEKKTGNIATKIAEEARLRAIMVEQEYSTNCIAVPLVRHCYGLIKKRRDPWKSRITGRLREYFPISTAM